MRKGYIRLLITSLLLILSLTLNSSSNVLNIYTLILFLFISLTIVLCFLGYEKNNHRYQKDIMLTVFIYSMVYIVITNVVGVFIGFNKSAYNLSFLAIMKNIVPVIFIIVLSELIRYIIITKVGKSRILYILALAIFVLLDITIIIHRYRLELLDELINFIFAVILPSVSRNIMLNYITYKVGFKPTILYRFIFDLSLYFLPIFPDFGVYVGSVIQIVSPVILLYIIYYNFEQTRNKKIVMRNPKFNYGKISTIGFAIVILIIVALSSGWFKYCFLTIGSESMIPSINKGDIVLVEKLGNKEIGSLKEGDILVFNYLEKIIVHRIIRIVEVQDNQYFYTKGDNNKTEDGYPIEKKDIIGTTAFKIPFLGYPTVWLNELMSR